LFFLAAAPSERKNKPTPAERENPMKLEEIKNKTNEAVSYLVASFGVGREWSVDKVSQRNGPVSSL
jgi:hypothetical protein